MFVQNVYCTDIHRVKYWVFGNKRHTHTNLNIQHIYSYQPTDHATNINQIRLKQMNEWWINIYIFAIFTQVNPQFLFTFIKALDLLYIKSYQKKKLWCSFNFSFQNYRMKNKCRLNRSVCKQIEKNEPQLQQYFKWVESISIITIIFLRYSQTLRIFFYFIAFGLINIITYISTTIGTRGNLIFFQFPDKKLDWLISPLQCIIVIVYIKMRCGPLF